jgi:hypothetical protein
MASNEDLERIREQSDKAHDYFSKVDGFQPSEAQEPKPAEEEASSDAAAPAKPEPPLSEAEKYFKDLLGKS